MGVPRRPRPPATPTKAPRTNRKPEGPDVLAELADLGALGDEDACLDYLRDLVFPAGAACPKCERPSRFHRVRGRSAYSCQHCGCHVYPTAGTIFRRSTTDLRIWFRGIALVSAQPGTVTAGDLEGELGVSRPTASRMLARIVPVVELGPELLFTSTAPQQGRAPKPAPRPVPKPVTKGEAPAAPGPPPELLSPDLVRGELLASLAGLRADLHEAELKASDAVEEVDALREAVASIERLAGGEAGSARR